MCFCHDEFVVVVIGDVVVVVFSKRTVLRLIRCRTLWLLVYNKRDNPQAVTLSYVVIFCILGRKNPQMLRSVLFALFNISLTDRCSSSPD